MVYAPTTVTTAETFLWYQAHPRVQLGLAHLWKQNAVRYLASVKVVEETTQIPAVSLSAGVQGIGTGNPGYAATLEKNFRSASGTFNAYFGIGFRSNESHSHFLGGFKWSLPSSPVTLGIQLDGHTQHPFVTYSYQQWVTGFYLIGGKNPAYMLGVKF